MEPRLLARTGMPAALLREGRVLRTLVAAFAVVALAFIASSIATFSVAQRIDAGVDDLLGNALPSVTELIHATRANHELNTYVQVLSRAPAGASGMVGQLSAARAELEANVAAAMRTPDYPRERAIYEEQVRPPLAAVDRSVDALLDVIERKPDDERALLAAASTLGSATWQLDLALESITELNQGHAYEAATSVLRSRVDAFRLGLYLDVAAALVAVIAAAIVFRTARAFTVHARKQVEREAERARELDTFAQRVAHDLLNPLAGMSFSLDTLARRQGAPEANRVVGNAKRALERARRMVEGIYAFARSGARPEPGSVAPLRTTVREAVDGVLSAEAESPPAIEVEPFEDFQVAIDPAVLSVIVTNLLSNAAKYTRDCPERRITVRARMRDGRAHVEVEDTGPGVPRGMEQAIFEPYRRAPAATQPGLGLGLATVKRIVGSHGGDVGVRRAPTGGSVFWFELPLGAVPQGRAAPSLGRPSTVSR